MYKANFCAECGERLAPRGWRGRLGRRLCDSCAQRLGVIKAFRPLLVIVLVAVAAFAIGRYLRPASPPLIIQRAANSPLPDGPVEFTAKSRSQNANARASTNTNLSTSVITDEVYICGARTKKGTPCQRRVHAPGERCFQHKGRPAMVPLEKLIIKTK